MIKTLDFLHTSIADVRNFDWYELTELSTVGSWPAIIKHLLCCTVFMICLIVGYWFHVRPLQATLLQLAEQEGELHGQLASSTELADNLDEYRESIRKMDVAFDALLAQLPAETEMAGLLEDISSAGVSSDLEFSSIQLQDEIEREFYIEQPMTIKVLGGYHDIGRFVSGVAALSRIVTLHNFTLGKTDDELSMTIDARTYRYKNQND